MLWLDYYWHKKLKRPYSLSKRIDVGKGQPVVFLHGIGASGENWRSMPEMLDRKKYKIVAFDLLGFGDSPRPDWLEYSVEDHAKAVLATLRRNRIKRPIILVGHSMGSLVAAYIAQKYPGKVKHLILYQMPIYGLPPSLNVKDYRSQAYLSVFKYLAEHPRMTLWYARVLGKAASKVAGFALDESSWQPFEMSLRNTIMQQQAYENLHTLRMPTDVIYGKYDALVLKKNMRHFFRPTKYLRFYEIKEMHRVSARASTLITQLITEDPKKRQELNNKHARLVEMIDVKHLAQKKQTKPQYSKQPYIYTGLLCLIVFIVTTIVALGGVPAWERDIFMYLNNWQPAHVVTTLARIASDLVWVVVFLVAALFLIKKYVWAAWRLAVPGVLGYGTVFVLEHIIGRARPEVLLPAETVLRASQDGMGFPSGHAATIAAVMAALWLYLSWKMRVLAVLLVVAVSWSRIYLGVHFPLDVVSGCAVGVGVVCVLQALPYTWRQKLRLA